MKKKSFFTIKCLLIGIGSSTISIVAQTATTDEGMEINGVVWATRNVDAPGTFTTTPQDYGKLYQWNRTKAWDYNRTFPVPGWDRTDPPASNTWNNNVCPTGWRVPTKEEFEKLLEAPYTLTIKEDDYYYDPKDDFPYGYTFGIAPDTIFLPMGGSRDLNDGMPFMMSNRGYYWSSTMSSRSQAFFLYLDVTISMHSYYPVVSAAYTPKALSVRCVKEDASVTSLTNIHNEELKIYTRHHTIVVENTNGKVNIHNTTGQLIASRDGASPVCEIPVPTAGIYIVRVGNHIQQVMVK